MSLPTHKYIVRVYQPHDKAESLQAGTVVEPVDPHVPVYAHSAEEVEATIRDEVIRGTLPSGKVYQICPSFETQELIRSIAIIPPDHSRERVFLDPAYGIYGHLRRIRKPRNDS